MPFRMPCFIFLAILLCCIATPRAGAADLERDMQEALAQGRAIIEEVLARESGVTSADRDRIRVQAEAMASIHLLLNERFRQRMDRSRELPPRAAERHNAMSLRYRNFFDRYLRIVDGLTESGEALQRDLKALKALLDGIQSRKKQRIYGATPVKHPNFASVTPLSEPVIVPAYKGGDRTTSQEDLSGNPEAPISKEIAALAESLSWNPVEIYEWVKNEIDTQWYWGCMKGAEETLRQRSGNDSDQAALLMALMRAAGFPARYVRGVIGFFPGIEQAARLTGVSNPRELADFFRKAGIPHETVAAGGKIVDIRIEHVWVAVQVPYDNYRGVVIDDRGKAWLGLDTALKPTGYEWSAPAPVLAAFPWADIRDEYLGRIRLETPLSHLKGRIEAYLDEHRGSFPDTGYGDLPKAKTPVPEHLNLLPASLQFRQIAVTGEYTQLPEALMHTVRLRATDPSENLLFDETLPAFGLSNRELSLASEPETVEDQEIINAHGGLGNTPAYLVRLRPALRLEGRRIAVASDGLPMGEEYTLTVDLISPAGAETFQNTHVAGAVSAMTFVSGGAVIESSAGEGENGPKADGEADAARIFHDIGLAHIDRWNASESELAGLMQLALIRPMPTVVTVGAATQVSWLLDSPHAISVTGVYMDADLRAAETVGGIVMTEDLNPGTVFMQLSALEGSVLEHRVPEDLLQVDAISTAKLMGLAREEGTLVREIDAGTIEDLLPGLAVSDSVRESIASAVHRGCVVRIPESDIAYEDWTGIGYTMEDPGTGESGWMLAGDIAGGMTAWSLDRWPEYYRSRVDIQASDAPPNEDPGAALHIDKITATDLQKGDAGSQLARPLQVLVRDAAMRPVRSARVTFTATAGGGKLINGAATMTVASDARGIAAVDYVLGRKTGDNPVMWWEPGDIHARQVGENIIDAALARGVAVDTPFTAYGLPGEPAGIRRLFGDGNKRAVLSWAGFVSLAVEDANGNPVSNETVGFEALPPVENTPCDLPERDLRPALLFESGDPCIRDIPTYGQCESAAQNIDVVTDTNGAMVHVILGGAADADYRVQATCRDLSTVFTLASFPFGTCDEAASPSVEMILVHQYPTDPYGNNIDAGKTGEAITVRAKLYAIRDGEAEIDRIIPCDDGPKTCTAVAASGERVADSDFENMQVSFGGVAGVHVGGGIFEASYILKPGRQAIPIEAEGTLKIAQTIVTCSECSTRHQEKTFTASISEMTVYGVDYQVPPEVMVRVDADGFVRDDKAFRITGTGYTPATHTVELLKGGEAVAYLPVVRDAEIDTVTIARGFQFDPEGDYTMQAVMNAGTGVEIRSEPFPVILCRMGDIFVEGPDGPTDAAPPGGMVTARVLPDGLPVTWSYEAVLKGKVDLKLELDPATGVIHVDPESGNGKIRLKAAIDGVPGCFQEAILPIGCPECSTGTCDMEGGAACDLGCVDVRFSLGKGRDGISAGGIYLMSETLESDLSTPRALEFSTFAPDVEPVYDGSGALRQVMAPKAFVDIIPVDSYAYEIRYFRPDDVAGRVQGVFETLPGASPFTVWRIENPDRTPGADRRLVVARTAGDGGEIYEYGWNEADNAWSLAEGGGRRTTTRTEERSGGDRIVTETLADEAGRPASVMRTVYRSFAWGEAIVSQTTDPDGACLTTVSEYYDDPAVPGSYGRLRAKAYPDGSWGHYEYDDAGRLSAEIGPWLDSPEGSPAASARAVYYDYTPVDPSDTGRREDARRPRTVTEEILGVVVSRTYHAYGYDAAGSRTEISEQCQASSAGYGVSGNLRTVRVYSPPDTTRAGWGRLQRVEHPDGRMETIAYESGTYSPGSAHGERIFDPGRGDDLRITRTCGTVDAPEGIAYQTTRESTIQNHRGLPLVRETLVYTGEGYERIDWTMETHDAFDRVATVIRSDGTRTESEWGCCGKTEETDAYGTRRAFEYDDLHRIEAEVHSGAASETWPAQAEIRTRYRYDAAGRRTGWTVAGGGQSLSSETVYDLAGRTVGSTDAAGLTTTHAYEAGGRIITITLPGGATERTEHYLDGQPKSVSGTGAAARYYTYGVNPDGSRWSRVAFGAPDAPLQEMTTTDLLGRTVLVERPGPEGMEVSENRYDESGRLSGVTASGRAEILTIYDALGSPIRTGLDIDGNGLLAPASRDRITDAETAYVKAEGAWWQESVQRVYADDGNAESTKISTRRTRLTGLGAGGLTAESVSIDIHGNRTVQKSFTDRSNRTILRTIDTPDAEADLRSITFNGRLVSTTGKTGIATTLLYDDLGRQIGITDARTGTTKAHYDDKGRVASVQDPAGNQTTYVYDPATGRKIAEGNALGKFTRYAYNVRGQITQTWGDTVYPARYVYDDIGRLVELHTYRHGAAWEGDIWPDDAVPDITRWRYDPATSLLTARTFADGTETTFGYGPGGRFEKRTWARTGGEGEPIVTAYAYDPATGELVAVDYSDDTPDIGFTYDRLGRSKTVTDAVGTRTHAYNSALQPASEAISGLYERVLERSYAVAGVRGRPNGFSMGGDYAVTYGYDAAGRFDSITWNAGGASDRVDYAYVPDSDLLGGYAAASGIRTAYAYEPNRNLKTRVENTLGTDVISTYEYRYDVLGRRISVVNTGTAFAENGLSRYGYNNRDELTDADRHLGADPSAPGAPVVEQHRAYAYDPIGNRRESVGWNEAAERQQKVLYETNVLNQYATLSENGTARSPSYDADGNMSGHAGSKYTWDAENRLTAVEPETPETGSRKVTFLYDYLGRRVQKQVFIHNGETWNQVPDETRRFVYDGWHLIQETVDTGGGKTDQYYVWGLDLSQGLQSAGGIGGLLCTVEGATAQYFAYDANGNVGQLVDAQTAAIAAHYEYDPFGMLVHSRGERAKSNPHRFSTKYYDEETGLYYYGQRYYLPHTGRWMNRDPIGESGGPNLYGFVWNDGINYSDFLGLALYAFDGTGTDEETFTHVRMLYESYHTEEAEYEQGIGSRWYSKVLGGITGMGGSLRLESMYRKMVKNYEGGDKNIDIIGFSRGAALAREFANMIKERGIAEFRSSYVNVSEGRNEWAREKTRVIDCRPVIRFVGLFDTVGSFFIPGNYIDLGIRMELPENVEHAAHAVARHEYRADFPLTQLNIPRAGQHFMQKVFPGDHSDIGGGHMDEQNLLALEPLRYIWEAGRNAGVPFGNIPFEQREDLWGPYNTSYEPHDLTTDWKYRSGPQRENLKSFNIDLR